MTQTIKNVASSAWAAPVLLSILLAYTVYSNQQLSATIALQSQQIKEGHDLFLVLKTQIDNDRMIAERERQGHKDDMDRESTWRENISNKYNKHEILLSQLLAQKGIKLPGLISNAHVFKESN